MFMGTLTSPFFNHLIWSSSSGFTELILIGERVESGIKSGKILMVAISNVVKKPFSGKKETKVFYGQKGRSKNDRYHSIRAVFISNPVPVQQLQQGNQCRSDAPRRKFTRISMPLSQALQHMLKELITL